MAPYLSTIRAAHPDTNGEPDDAPDTRSRHGHAGSDFARSDNNTSIIARADFAHSNKSAHSCTDCELLPDALRIIYGIGAASGR